ncbi:hypothetical protein GGI35DRAFT_434948, partial [Trichoderma velutinum]
MKAAFIASILYTNLTTALSVSSRQLPPLIPSIGQLVTEIPCWFIAIELERICEIVRGQVHVVGCNDNDKTLDLLRQACDTLKDVSIL